MPFFRTAAEIREPYRFDAGVHDREPHRFTAGVHGREPHRLPRESMAASRIASPQLFMGLRTAAGVLTA